MPTINSLSTKALFDCLLQAGVSQESLSQESGLSYDRLVLPDQRVPLAQHVRLWLAAEKTIGRRYPEFALELGRAIAPEQSGIVGNVFMQSNNLLEAGAQVARYSRLIAESDQWSAEESTDGKTIAVCYRIQPIEFYTHYAVERAFATAVSWNQHFLQDQSVIPLAVFFEHAEPDYADQYSRFFSCPVSFKAGENRILFSKSAMLRPNPRPNNYLQSVLLAHAEHLQSQLPDVLPFTQTVKELITSFLPTGRADMEQVASQLAVSTKTLYRRLKEEGNTFQTVLDQTRMELAKRHLGESNLSLDDISFLLGFSETSAFYRACKRWYGQSPKSLRSR